MVVVNTELIPGKQYSVISLVTGCCIMSKNFLKDFGSGIRNFVGGQMETYTKMMEESMNIAIDKMIQNAQALDADAIVNVRFTSSSIVQGGAEVIASGTAVKFY